MSPGTVLRDARRRHGITQKQLAARAGTTQSAISRIEKDRVSPTFETLGELLDLLGEDLAVRSKRRDTGIDLALNEDNLRLSTAARLRRGLGFSETVRRGRGERIHRRRLRGTWRRPTSASSSSCIHC